MDKVVGLVNKLQEICTLLGDNALSENSVLWNQLPTIVVVGGQSSGKSSVLEAVVGRDFLPRGTGIVTRRPLVLQLVKLEDPNATEYGEFLHCRGKKWFDFDEIRQEIDAETERHTRKVQKIVSPDPIQLAVYSPHVPNLTLVDLPGLTKVPIDGQPISIVKDLEDMARRYVKGDNAIILAVSPANADLATSDALRLAREVDPYGERTLGVLTKIDIMDRGTDCRDILLGKTMRLKNGWVAIVNRAQADINMKMTMRDARDKEKEFFQGIEAYRDLENIGIGYLSEKLSLHLIKEIRNRLPQISQYIESNIDKHKKEMEVLGGDALGSRGAMLHKILTLCQQVEKAFDKTVDGGKNGGERILDVFEIKLKDAIQKLPFEKILTLKNVRNIVNEADGYQSHLIAPEAGYRRLIEEGLLLLREPATLSVDQVHQILKSIVNTALQTPECRELTRYTNLKIEIQTHAARTLDKLKSEAEAMVRQLVDMEGSYLSANFFREIVAAESYGGDSRTKPQFVTLSGEMLFSKNYEAMPAGEAHLQRISDHVSAYLHVVRSQLLATVPKAIVHCIVVPAKTKLLGELQMELAGLDEPQLVRLLSEAEDVQVRREEVRKRLSLLQKARDEVSQFS